MSSSQLVHLMYLLYRLQLMVFVLKLTPISTVDHIGVCCSLIFFFENDALYSDAIVITNLEVYLKKKKNN